MLLLKFPDELPDQVQDLAVTGPAFIFGDIVQFVVEFRIDLDPEMLIVLVPHIAPLEIKITLYYKVILLRNVADILKVSIPKVYLLDMRSGKMIGG